MHDEGLFLELRLCYVNLKRDKRFRVLNLEWVEEVDVSNLA